MESVKVTAALSPTAQPAATTARTPWRMSWVPRLAASRRVPAVEPSSVRQGDHPLGHRLGAFEVVAVVGVLPFGSVPAPSEPGYASDHRAGVDDRVVRSKVEEICEVPQEPGGVAGEHGEVRVQGRGGGESSRQRRLGHLNLQSGEGSRGCPLSRDRRHELAEARQQRAGPRDHRHELDQEPEVDVEPPGREALPFAGHASPSTRGEVAGSALTPRVEEAVP